MNLLRYTAQGADEDIQLTDAPHHLSLFEIIEAYYLQGKSHGCGCKIDYLKAVGEYALQDENYSTIFVII